MQFYLKFMLSITSASLLVLFIIFAYINQETLTPHYSKFLIRKPMKTLHQIIIDSKGLIEMEGTDISNLWPITENETSDRILEQMDFIVPNEDSGMLPKRIFLARRINPEGSLLVGSASFEKCPVKACEILIDHSRWTDADAVIFTTVARGIRSSKTYKGISLSNMNNLRPKKQVWIYETLEPPHVTPRIQHRGVFNWTATYRRDSDIVTPYARWVENNSISDSPNPNIAASKTKMVAMFVSDCRARNGRLEYAEELGRHIDVDIYGKCGTLKCPRLKSAKCNSMLRREYRFYLAFENCNCRGYITEKLFRNSFLNNVLPIVMGPPRSDYEAVSPPDSFLHVDDFQSPAHLASYLHQLAANHSLYNSYFRWHGTGEFIDTKYFCRLCAMLHDPKSPKMKIYKDVSSWWKMSGICSSDVM